MFVRAIISLCVLPGLCYSFPILEDRVVLLQDARLYKTKQGIMLDVPKAYLEIIAQEVHIQQEENQGKLPAQLQTFMERISQLDAIVAQSQKILDYPEQLITGLGTDIDTYCRQFQQGSRIIQDYFDNERNKYLCILANLITDNECFAAKSTITQAGHVLRSLRSGTIL